MPLAAPRYRPASLLGLLGLLAGCETLGPPSPLPSGAVLLSPPPYYREWWARTESCAGLAGDFAAVEWYVVPGVSVFETDAGPKVGLWAHSSAGQRIVLAGEYAGHELVVRHEMLHALLDRGGHPPEYFRERCRLTWETWAGEEQPALARSPARSFAPAPAF